MTYLNPFLEENIKIQENVNLAQYTSLNIGGNAKYFIDVESETDLINGIRICNNLNIPYFILGNGSNTLVLDYGVDGLVFLVKKQFSKIELLEENTIKCQAGALLKDVCLFALEHEFTGLESLYGIPASIGGAVYMNAGAYDGEIKDNLLSCEVLFENGKIQTLSKDECELSYRHSYFMSHDCIILSATFSLKKGNSVIIKEKMDDFMLRRTTKQPLDYYSAGSTFKRPRFNYASALIDRCGLKGFSVNDAEVSTKHAGFLINKNNASSKDFIKLINHIQSKVYLETGYFLDPEIQILR